MDRKRLLAIILCLLMITMMTACSRNNEPAAEENPDVQQSAGEEQPAAFTGDLIISAEEAAALVGSDDVIFVDCTGEADKGTVKGAVATTWQDMCTCSEEYGSAGDDSWGKIPEPADLSARLGALGLDKSKQIITLGHTLKGWGEDARIAWELRAAGYENVRMQESPGNSELQAMRMSGSLTEVLMRCLMPVQRSSLQRAILILVKLP